jgi:protein-export membrane protein SecD
MNEPIVSIEFDETGAELFEKITTENVGEQLAIFLDGELMSAPRINEPISGGSAIISGNFSAEEARDLVRNLNFGALPMEISLVSTQSIGATLGERAIDAGVTAGLLGLLVVGLFMTLWYRLSGLFAAISLVIYVLMMLAIFKLIPVTLTAAGLAGLVLSIGLAVDANILISERLREELRRGKKPIEAVREGFSQAWTSIRDGNLVNILSGVILYWFGDVFIEGFAFTLIIGTIVSLLSSLVISRTLLMAFCALSTEGRVWRFLMGSGLRS